MPIYVPWIIGILTGIIVCSQTENNRWLKSFLISAAIVIISNIFINSQGSLNTDRFVALLGQSIGISLVTGSAGFGIGSAIFRKKQQKNKTWDNISTSNQQTMQTTQNANSELQVTDQKVNKYLKYCYHCNTNILPMEGDICPNCKEKIE